MRNWLRWIMIIGCFVILGACVQDVEQQPHHEDEGEINIPLEEEVPAREGVSEEEENGRDEEEQLSDEPSLDESTLVPTPDEKSETHQVILYFSDHDLMGTYRIETEIDVRTGENVAKTALEAWLKGPDHEELTGLIDSEVIIEYVEDVDGVAHVSFSKAIQESNLGSTGELMIAEQLSMIMQQFGFDRTQILVEGRVGETLLGHLFTGDPIVAGDPNSYLWIDEKKSPEIVLENVAFKIYEPAPNTEVKDRFVVRGLARVYEATVLYEFEDGHFILDEGFTTATEGAPGWGEFEIIIEFDEVANQSGRVILFEESAKDGSRINELQIPVKVTN
ncbi:Gmad2 immunoglobulin-like domain-containing protein [Alkalihalobacterium alkalinitrilicum]|uniref:Gmad2 immunoglobulin-like domain-containing protein n=1 Tax=Alkalihalobacterium alkalinitrilicum TaxID=427920 RepID=UPI000994C135|nr:Gmad2 immunoglobulin-like domain-containing protein [Alkalihalobacterium alkalinitrilicum]